MIWLAPRFPALIAGFQLWTLLSTVNGLVQEVSLPVGNSHNALRSRAITQNELADVYDYIVVGGGQSGLVIANRLSENAKRSVLVVEYGYFEDNPAQLDPSSGMMYQTKHLFNVTSVPQRAMNNRPGMAFAASVVGGGSAINGMLFDRGSAEDYDNWERLGNPGWGWKGLLPYFKKSTTFTPPRADLAEEFNITWDIPSAYGNGPIQVTYPDWFWPAQKVQWQAWKELGAQIQVEGAAGNAHGAFWVPSVVNQTYHRSYSRTAYYDPVASRENLNLIVGHRVNEVLFDKKKRAVAITLQERGTPNGVGIVTVKAKQEIVLCAGWMNTPLILQRSGIGPKSLLDQAKVKVLVDAPGVGSNLQDHPAWRAGYTYLTDLLPNRMSLSTNATFQAWAVEQWKYRKGPYSVGVGNALATPPLQDMNPEYRALLKQLAAQNATEYLPVTYTPAQTRGFLAQRKLLVSTFAKRNNGVVEIPFTGGASTALVLEKPVSRGTIFLNTIDVYGTPTLDFNTNINPFDTDVIISSIRYYRRWMSMPTHQQLTPIEYSPGANLTSDADLKANVAATMGMTTMHSSGTAAMAPRELAGVVSPTLEVYGVKGLSVGDISLVPMIPATHTCATVYAISEKAADLIKSRFDPKALLPDVAL